MNEFMISKLDTLEKVAHWNFGMMNIPHVPPLLPIKFLSEDIYMNPLVLQTAKFYLDVNLKFKFISGNIMLLLMDQFDNQSIPEMHTGHFFLPCRVRRDHPDPYFFPEPGHDPDEIVTEIPDEPGRDGIGIPLKYFIGIGTGRV